VKGKYGVKEYGNLATFLALFSVRFHSNLAVAAVNLVHILLTENEVISYGMHKDYEGGEIQ